MSDLDSYAFEPGQQVQCKTRFDDVFKGEVVAFDLSSKILILKSPPTSGGPTTHDLHFLVLDSVSDVKVLEEPHGQCANDKLPCIDMKHINAKQVAATAERMRLVEAVSNGVSQEGISLYSVLSKKYDRASDITWKDNVKIVVMNAVVISPPYREADCQPLTPKTQKEAVSYVKSIVRKFWESCEKQKQQQQSNTVITTSSSTTSSTTATTNTTTTSTSTNATSTTTSTTTTAGTTVAPSANTTISSTTSTNTTNAPPTVAPPSNSVR